MLSFLCITVISCAVGQPCVPGKVFSCFLYNSFSYFFSVISDSCGMLKAQKQKDPHAPQGCAERRFSICLKYSTTTNLHRNPASSPLIPTRTASSSRSTPAQPFAAQPQPSAPVPEQKKKGGKAGKDRRAASGLRACGRRLRLRRGSADAEKTRQPSRRAQRRPPPMRPSCSRPSGRQRLYRSHPLTPARYSRRARSMRRT